MNKDNLLRMADHIETVLQEMFDMKFIRRGDETTPECDSVGDIIGHCTRLDNDPLPILKDGRIDFTTWSESFTGIDSWSGEWDFLFASQWEIIDNTPVGAAKRIRYFVENGLPDNWEEIMHGQDPLPY